MSDESVAALRERDDEIARLKTMLAEMESSTVQADIEQKVATAKAEAETAAQVTIDDLQTKYDEAALEAATHKKAYEDLVAEIEKAREEAEAAEAKATIEKARLAAVEPFKEALGEKYVTENASRWAAMDDDTFQTVIEGFKAALGERAPKVDTIPTDTAMIATGEWKVKTGTSTSRSLVHDINAARERGVDIKRI